MNTNFTNFTNFNDILKETLINEGHFTNDSNDDGGMTIFGIARKKNPKWKGWKIVDDRIKLSKLDVTNKKHWLSITDLFNKDIEFIKLVNEFYRLNFWNEMQGDLIQDKNLAQSVFDFGVTAGIGTAIIALQKTVGTKPDGDFGPTSLRLTNSYTSTTDKKDTNIAFTLRKIERYYKITLNDKDDLKYIFGWVSRSFENFERYFKLDLSKDKDELIQLYYFIKIGRDSLTIRKDTTTCLKLIKNCLGAYNLK